jgi:hypothetical protein
VHLPERHYLCGEHRVVTIGAAIDIHGVCKPHRANQLLPLAHKETFLIGSNTADRPSDEKSEKNQY